MINLSAYLIGITDITYASIKQNKYLYAFLIFLAFFVLSKLVVLFIEKVMLRLAKRSKTELDDEILNKSKMPISLILFFWGIKLALIPIDIHAKVIDILYHIIDSLIIFTITHGVIKIVYVLISHWKKNWLHKTKTKLDDHLIGLFNRMAKYLLGLIGLMFVLQSWGIQIGPLLASLGIAGIAIAFAMQTTLANIFGGISLIVDETIRVGDVIKLDSGEIGKVNDIGIRSTKIMTPENIVLSLPNGKLADSRIQNFSQPNDIIRITLEIGVEYGSEPEKVKSIIFEELSKIRDVIKEPKPLIYFTEMGDFSLKFTVLFWVSQFDVKLSATDIALTNIYKALNKNKIGIPFPTRIVHLKK
ncbi:MAG: mechanosensitive ion channel family protein [Nanoarchaeota archaeon]